MHHLEYFSESSLSNDSHHFEVLQLGIILLGVLVNLSKVTEALILCIWLETFLDFIIFIWVLLLWVLL